MATLFYSDVDPLLSMGWLLPQVTTVVCTNDSLDCSTSPLLHKSRVTRDKVRKGIKANLLVEISLLIGKLSTVYYKFVSVGSYTTSPWIYHKFMHKYSISISPVPPRKKNGIENQYQASYKTLETTCSRPEICGDAHQPHQSTVTYIKTSI